MARGFRAYHVAAIRLGLGVSPSEAYHCWKRGIALDTIPTIIIDLRRSGITLGPIVKRGRPRFGTFDTRLNPAADRRKKKAKQGRLEPKWLRDIPQGGFEGMQEALKKQRANPDAMHLPSKVQKLSDKLRIPKDYWDDLD